MNRLTALALLLAPAAAANSGPPEVRPITLREAVHLALAHSPEIQLALLELEQAGADFAAARAERAPELSAGSGLGATAGIPQSVQGAVPSVVQVTVAQPMFDPGRPSRAARARAMVRAEEQTAEVTRDRAVYRAGLLYLDFELAGRQAERLLGDAERFERIAELTKARVEEGGAIPLEGTRAELDAARARARLRAAEATYNLLESDLRQALGLAADMRLQPQAQAREKPWKLPLSGNEAARRAVEEHPALAELEARVRAARHRTGEARSERRPRLDLVGQYALLAKFNNYDDYFRRFQRHNWQAGIALQVPLFAGRGSAERVARARLEEREARLRRTIQESAVQAEGHRAFEALQAAERHQELARLELSYARENLDVLLAQFEEGRVALDELERARALESAAWGDMVASQYDVSKAQLGLLYAMGEVADVFAD